MKRMLCIIALLASVSVLQLGIAQAPAGAPAGASGLCNDGTYSTSASKSGACRGHKGIKAWYAAPDANKSKTTAGKTTSTPAPATTATPTASAAQSAPAVAPSTPSAPAPKAPARAAAPAAGGGGGQVWLNTSSNVYHCQGSEWYGKTKAGAYMTEDEAKAKGARPDRGKPCK